MRRRTVHLWCSPALSPRPEPWHAAQASAELGSQWSDVIAPQDVATYGGLCALATLSRTELRSRVIDNIQFREFLEAVPEACTLLAGETRISIALARLHATAQSVGSMTLACRTLA